ncbi:MAG TPA: DUF3048 domain-containing protein [Acidimicrobiales bacterium]|nr:DUF3048 domain-containing protein [Acidimicrobiales bacterium]
MTKQRLGAALAAAMILLAGCGGGKDKKATAKPTTTTAPPSTTAAPAAATAPLTGLPPDPATAGRPALIVKIDNAPNGRPQHGINDADVVIEEGVEGGITRLATIFQSKAPEEVGPVRSARSTDISIATPLNRPLFAYSGTNAAFQALVNDAPLVVLSQDAMPGAYYRKGGRSAPYNLWARVGDLYGAAAKAGGAPNPLFTYLAAGEAPAGDPANGVTLQWKDKVATDVSWTWDAGAGVYHRVMNGTPHVDDDGNQVGPKNVIVQFTEYVITPYVDAGGNPVPEAKLVGGGDAWILTGGKIVKGHWQRDAVDQVTRYLDAAGNPVKLTPGPTWVELPKPDMATSS